MNGLNVLHASATVIQKLVHGSWNAFVCRHCIFYWCINRASFPVMDGKTLARKWNIKQDKNKCINNANSKKLSRQKITKEKKMSSLWIKFLNYDINNIIYLNCRDFAMRKVMRMNNHVKPKSWNFVSRPRFHIAASFPEVFMYSVIKDILLSSLDWIFWLERRMSFLYPSIT